MEPLGIEVIVGPILFVFGESICCMLSLKSLVGDYLLT